MKGNRIWLLGTVAVIAVVVVIGWLLGISPKLAEADAATSQIADVNAQNAVHEATLAQLKEQYESLDELKADLAEMRKEIPSLQPTDEFVNWISASAQAATVFIKKITIGEPNVYGTASLAEGQAPAPVLEGEEAPVASGPAAPEGVYTIPVQIEVTGSAANIIVFSKLMQTGTRLFVVPTFTFTSEESVGIMSGYLYIIDDPNAPAFTLPTPEPTEEAAEEPTEEPSPEPSDTPTPDPTATNG